MIRCYKATVVVLSLVFLSTHAHAQYEIIEIAQYRTDVFSTQDSASIDLFNVENQLVGILIFLPEEEGKLPSATKGGDGVIRLYYWRPRYRAIVEMLRESRVRLSFWIPHGENSYIGMSSREPVGVER